MKQLFSCIAILLCATVAHAQSDKLKIDKLNDHMYVYTTYQEFKGVQYSSNAMYVLTTNGAILIDTPWDKEQYEPLVNHIQKEHNKQVKWVITTHFHEDRSGGLDYFNKLGAKTFTYSLTNEILKERNEPQAKQSIDAEHHFIVEGETLSVHFLGEGHSKDNTVIWFPKEKVLYGGCLIKSAEATTIGNIEDGNVQAWPKTIEAVKQKFHDAQYIIPGHDAWNMPGHIENTERILNAYNQQNLSKNK